MKRDQSGNMVPKLHDILLNCSIMSMCPDLPDKNRKRILNALRHNYAYRGHIYKKIKSYEKITLDDLYSSYVAFYRHKFTEYKDHNEVQTMHLFKQFFNDHKNGSKIFGKYYTEVVKLEQRNKSVPTDS